VAAAAGEPLRRQGGLVGLALNGGRHDITALRVRPQSRTVLNT
jgi:hypothetical protein